MNVCALASAANGPGPNMSDLDSFFAKKDRKKKKKAPSAPKLKPKPVVPATPAEEEASGPAVTPVVTATPVQDGWIELEDPKTAQVNTGGRVVKQFRRDGEDVSATNTATSGGGADDVEDTTEKFSGWSLDKEEEPVVEPEPEPEPQKAVYRPSALRQAWKPAGPDVKSSAQFPSLADAVKSNAPEVPQSLKAAQVAAKKAAASGLEPTVETRSRPRFINSKAGTGAAGRPRFINSKAMQ